MFHVHPPKKRSMLNFMHQQLYCKMQDDLWLLGVMFCFPSRYKPFEVQIEALKKGGDKGNRHSSNAISSQLPFLTLSMNTVGSEIWAPKNPPKTDLGARGLKFGTVGGSRYTLCIHIFVTPRAISTCFVFWHRDRVTFFLAADHPVPEFML